MNHIVTKSNQQIVPSYNSLTAGYQSALKIVDDIVLKNYISELPKMEIVPLNEGKLGSSNETIRLFKINRMVYEREEFAVHKFTSVFNALSIAEATIFIIINSDGIKTDFYMGVRADDPSRTIESIHKTVKKAMYGQFPGIKTEVVYDDGIHDLIKKIDFNNISAVSGIANQKTSVTNNANFIQGLEKLVVSMQGEKYTGIIIANGTKQEQLKQLQKEYENIYTQLSALSGSQLNYAKNQSQSHSKSESKGTSFSKTKTEGTSESRSSSYSNSNSTTTGISETNSSSKMLNSISAASSLIGAALMPVTGGASLIVGGVIGAGAGMLGNALGKTMSHSTTQSETNSQSQSSSRSFSSGQTDSESFNTSLTQGQTNGISESITINVHDKSVENILKKIDKQLERIEEFESLGMYECAAYFVAQEPHIAESAASIYKSLMQGENTGIEISTINSWYKSQSSKTSEIKKYLSNFMHPVFRYENAMNKLEVTPASLVSGKELAIHMGLPRQSVCGLPVTEYVSFGKEVVRESSSSSTRSINLGKIFNMGNIEENYVKLDTDSLTMHTLVTGSTGSGKSNTVYEMLRQLDSMGANFLVIEPAKGEYKNVFGNLKGVKVFGTNPQVSDVLKINPFRFPKGIHVLEHIDRLIGIFNVCWEMYAAMPVILKDALLYAYEACGWNLDESTNLYSDELFPTFQDLLEELINVINNSAYSEEIKSNYAGALITRVRSLTNGLNGQIFTSDEIGDEQLFDKKVIVDLSRIGSLETKSLIMGILIMRLNEYRMTTSQEMNLPLQHVTVLEEAHNILRSSAQTQENVTGKSVEIISNSIAEMRTYGEGFIIVDQSPNAIDISAIRNTNTKIIMRLPEQQDRTIVGKGAALKDNQLDEIARLPKGVSVVYQNDWLEPVLCQIKKYEGVQGIYKFTPVLETTFSHSSIQLIRNLIYKSLNERMDMNLHELLEFTLKSKLKTRTKLKLYQAFKSISSIPLDKISEIIYEIVYTPEVAKEAELQESIEDWKNTILFMGAVNFSEEKEQIQNKVVECILHEQIARNDKPEHYLEIWNSYLKGEVM